jgi:hypothetical protein
MARRKRKVNFPPVTASTVARGYGTTHQAERKRWGLVVDAGHAVCCRCHLPIAPGASFHLDHRDDKLGYLGVSHPGCNLRAAARRGNLIMRAKKALDGKAPARRVSSRVW